MSYEAGSVIGGIERGESDTDSVIKSDSRNQSGRFQGPELIGGYESEEPRTERISSDNRTGTGEPKLTKSGRIDGRTLRGKRTTGSSTQKSDAVGVGLESLSLSDAIYDIHAFLAGLTSVPEFELDKDESEKLGRDITNFGKFYGATFDPKKVAAFNLGVTICGIYGIRIMAVRNRLNAEKLAKGQAPNAAPKPTPINNRNRQEPQATVTMNGKPSEPVPSVIPGWGMETGSL